MLIAKQNLALIHIITGYLQKLNKPLNLSQYANATTSALQHELNALTEQWIAKESRDKHILLILGKFMATDPALSDFYLFRNKLDGFTDEQIYYCYLHFDTAGEIADYLRGLL